MLRGEGKEGTSEEKNIDNGQSMFLNHFSNKIVKTFHVVSEKDSRQESYEDLISSSHK